MEREREILHLGEDHENKGSLGRANGNRAQCGGENSDTPRYFVFDHGIFILGSFSASV